ncbi:sugar ABC transporter substrate-binding protein [Halorussus gelatinilyticus]
MRNWGWDLGAVMKQTRRSFLKATGATGVAGVAGSASALAQNKSITFYNAGSLQYDPGTEKNIQRFEEETGITVNVNEVPWSNLKTSLITQWRNQGSEVDAFNGPTWWLADFVAANWIVPLDLPSDHVSKYPKNLQELIQFDGQAYMAPQLGKWGTYLYDKQALQQNNIQQPPQNWDQIIQKGKKMSDGNQSGFAFTWANKDVFTFKQFLYQAGGQLFNDNNEPTFVNKGVDVFNNLLTPLRKQNVIPDGISTMGEGPVGDAFIGGSLATVESWTPLASRAWDSDDWSQQRLGVAKPPKGPQSRATFQDTNGIGVSKFSQNKQAAKRFAQFMSTTESLKTDMVTEGNPAPVSEVYDMPEVKQEFPQKWLDVQQYNLTHAKSETYRAQPQVDNYLSNQITPALLGKKPPKQALQTAEQNIRQLYKNLGIL